MAVIKLLRELLKLRENQTKTKSEIKNLQNEKLRKLLSFAYQNSPYYRKAFEKAGVTEENLGTISLSDLPTINKTTLLEQFDDVITTSDITQNEMRVFDKEEKISKKVLKNQYHVVHSSGSTGIPSYFLYDETAWNQMLIGIIRGALWNMTISQIFKLLLKDPRIAYLAATDGRYGGVMAVSDGIEGLRAKEIQLDVNQPTAEWICKIREFQPNIIIGYPSAIKILSELVQQGKVRVNPVRVISCGEPLDLGLRNYLEDVFQVPLINFYGASESLAIGVEASKEEGMVLFDDMNIIESIDGKMYLTCLYNYAMPLIRYEITDSIDIEQAKETDSCPFSRVTGLIGRNEDILWFTDKDGKREFLHPLAVEGMCIENLKDYQFHQVGEQEFELFAEVEKDSERRIVCREIQKELSRILSEKGLEFVRYQIRFVDTIAPNSKTGKKQLILIDSCGTEAIAI